MPTCLNNYIFQILLAYLDDIIVYSNTFYEHIERLDSVFTRLLEHGLKLKPEKCKFLHFRVTYVGHQISSDGITTDPDKTLAVFEWKPPTTVKELRSFLGLKSFTDNNPLKYLQTTAKIGALEQRWDALLTLFDFIINYWSGRSNANADSLSRQPHGPVPDETEESKEDELLHIESVVTMATSVPPDLSHALVTTPIPTEMRQMAVHEPDHNLSTTNPSSDEDKKLPRDDTVIATTLFPTHTKEELITMQKVDPTMKEFLKFWEKLFPIDNQIIQHTGCVSQISSMSHYHA